MDLNPNNDNDEEQSFEYIQSSPGSEYFDIVIGHIEEIVVGEDFQALQKSLFEKHWQTFERSEENKIEYMAIFNEYTTTIEAFIVNKLNTLMTNFSMEQFSEELEQKKMHLDGEIFDLLNSLLDFVAFKELILDYRDEKEGKFNNAHFEISVVKLSDSNEDERQ